MKVKKLRARRHGPGRTRVKCIVSKTDAQQQRTTLARQRALPIEDLDFTTRLYKIVKRAGINTVGELIDHTAASLREMQVGPLAISEIELELAALDPPLWLKGSEPIT